MSFFIVDILKSLVEAIDHVLRYTLATQVLEPRDLTVRPKLFVQMEFVETISDDRIGEVRDDQATNNANDQRQLIRYA